jgi:hypothetical protein
MRVFFAILGVVVIILQTLALGESYSGLDSPIWGYLLGIGLIVAPFTALGMLIGYLLMIAAIVAPSILGFLIVKEVTGSSGLGAIGFIAGIAIGMKFAGSEVFDRLLEPFRRLADKEEKD